MLSIRILVIHFTQIHTDVGRKDGKHLNVVSLSSLSFSLFVSVSFSSLAKAAAWLTEPGACKRHDGDRLTRPTACFLSRLGKADRQVEARETEVSSVN